MAYCPPDGGLGGGVRWWEYSSLHSGALLQSTQSRAGREEDRSQGQSLNLLRTRPSLSSPCCILATCSSNSFNAPPRQKEVLRQWQQKPRNSGVTPQLILCSKFQISVHSKRQTIPNLQTAKGMPMFPVGTSDARPTTWSRSGCGPMSLSSSDPGETWTLGVWAVCAALAPSSDTASRFAHSGMQW